MRVLHLIDHMGLGGSQACLLDQLEARKEGIDYRVLSLSDRHLTSSLQRMRAANVPYRSLGLRKWQPWGWFKLRQALARAEVDLVHTHLDFSHAFGTAAGLSLGAARPRILVHLESPPAAHQAWLHRLTARAITSRADAFLSISEHVAEQSRGWLVPEGAPTRLIESWLEVERFERQRAAEETVRQLRSGATLVVGAIGRLSRQKGMDLALEAMPGLLREEPATRLLIAGDGPMGAELRRLAERLGIQDAVRFLGAREDIPDILAALDCFMLPSRYEGFGVAFLEAMAAGVPIVATDAPGIGVTSGFSGLLVPCDQPEALAAAVLRLARDRELRDRLVSNAARWVREHHDRAVRVPQVEAFYDEVVASGARPSTGDR